MSTQPAADLFAAYRQAEAALAAGQIRQAADLCKQMLDTDPDFAYGHHLMAVLFRATGNLDKALSFADLAIKHGPEVAQFHMHQGQVWLLRGHLPAAAMAFKKAHQLEPANPVYLILLADTRTHQKKFDVALDLYQQARALQDMPEIDEHEGSCLLLKGDVAGADRLFTRLIESAPNYAPGYIHKAKLLVGKKLDSEAEPYFIKALAINPKAYDALLSLSMLYYRQHQLPKAVECAQRATIADPGNWRGLVLLGGLLVSLKDYAAAEKIFRQVLILQPESTYGMHGLVSVLLPQKRLAEAAAYVEQVLKKLPNHPVMLYYQAMLSGQTVDTAPREYVSGLFDGYAEQFDQHLQQTLGYKVPALLASMLRQQIQGKAGLSMLDLGCGTGLAGEACKEFTGFRVGIDVSMGMLEKAAEKRLYNELHQYDAVMYMLASNRKFDLLAATDVFIYVGNMAPFFKAARNVMAEDSLFGFSIELEEGDGFRLNPTGRYSHSLNYVTRLAASEGYVLLAKQGITVRAEADKPAEGVLFVLKKMQTH